MKEIVYFAINKYSGWVKYYKALHILGQTVTRDNMTSYNIITHKIEKMYMTTKTTNM